MVDPEADPGEHDDEDAGQVGLEHEVADVSLQAEAQGEALVDSRSKLFLKTFDNLFIFSKETNTCDVTLCIKLNKYTLFV